MYVVVELGVTVLLAPLPRLCDQEYIYAPLALITEFSPKHNISGKAFVIIIGVGFTITPVLAVLLHPSELVTVTIYVPLINVSAFGLLGFCNTLTNPFGPDQL